MTHRDRAQAFDSILTIEQERARFPSLHDYCVRVLGLTFRGDHSCCPVHGGESGQAFQIDQKTGKWQCWSTCRDNCPRHANGKIDRSQKCTCRGDVLDLHFLCFEFNGMREAAVSLANGCQPPLPARRRPLENAKCYGVAFEAGGTDNVFLLDSTRIARALREFGHVNRGYLLKASPVRRPTAADFAEVLLELLGPDDLPIVFRSKFQAIIGKRAVSALRNCPESLQYVCCCTGKRAAGSNTNGNLKERLFLDVEFDDTGLNDQLRLIWYLKTRRGWRLISVTHSAGKSYHALFLVRGFSEARIERMKALALSLGACASSLRPHQPVRFPGGFRTMEDWRNTPVGRQRIIYLDPQASKKHCRSHPSLRRRLIDVNS